MGLFFYPRILPARGGNFRGYCKGCMGIKINTTRDSGEKIGKNSIVWSVFSKMDTKQIFHSFLLLHHQKASTVIHINMLQGYF